ncbi:MAG: MATE family efflux transporter [Chitinophagales bacterium]
MTQLKATYKEIWEIALPLILGNLAWTLIGLTDQAFMGRVSREAEAAIGPVSIFYSILFMIGFGYTRGTQILIARYMGEGKPRKVGEIIDNTLVTMIGTALLLLATVLVCSHTFLHFIMTDQQVIAQSESFLYYRIWGIVASFISCVFISFYSGIGKTSILSISVGTMALLNIGLNYVLVFGKFGFPAMGIKGSGLASSIAEWVSLVIMVAGVFYKNRREKFNLFEIRKVNFPLIGYMSKVSFPLVIQSVIANSAWFIFFTYIERMGQNQLAISNILRSLLMLIGIPVWSLGSVTNTLVGNLVGQDNLEEVKVAIKKISILSVGMVGAQCLIVAVFTRQVIGFFTPDQLQISDAVVPCYVMLGALMLMSFTNIFFNGVVSIGKTDYALYIEGAAILIYCVYFLTLFHIPGISLVRVWTAEWVYWTSMFIFSFLLLKRQNVHVF